MIRISMLSGNPNLNVRTAVAGSKTWSRDTSVSTCASGLHRLKQCHRAWREAHAIGASRQKLVAEQIPQSREVVTHRGLTNADASCRPRDAPFREQRAEMNEEIQVDTT